MTDTDSLISAIRMRLSTLDSVNSEGYAKVEILPKIYQLFHKHIPIEYIEQLASKENIKAELERMEQVLVERVRVI